MSACLLDNSIFERWFVTHMCVCLCVEILSSSSSGERYICGSQHSLNSRSMFKCLATSLFVLQVICILVISLMPRFQFTNIDDLSKQILIRILNRNIELKYFTELIHTTVKWNIATFYYYILIILYHFLIELMGNV